MTAQKNCALHSNADGESGSESLRAIRAVLTKFAPARRFIARAVENSFRRRHERRRRAQRGKESSRHARKIAVDALRSHKPVTLKPICHLALRAVAGFLHSPRAKRCTNAEGTRARAQWTRAALARMRAVHFSLSGVAVF